MMVGRFMMTSVSAPASSDVFMFRNWQKKQHAHEAVDDRRDAGECLGRVFDDADDAAVRRVLRQVDGSSHAERQHDQQRCDDDVERVEQVRQDADAVGEVARRGGQQRPRHVRQPLDEHIDDQKQHERRRDHSRRAHEDAHGEDVGSAAAGNGFLFHPLPSLLRLRKKLSVALMSMMNKKQHQRDGKQRLPLQAAGIGHFARDGGGQKAHALKQARHIRHVAGHHHDGHGLADGAADAEHDGGGDTAPGRRNGDAEVRLDRRRAERERRVLILRAARPRAP